MKKIVHIRVLIYLIFVSILILTSSVAFAQDTLKSKILVHYMPWYQAPPNHGYWGWHWTMNHYNPNKFLPSGRREIASHYYPLTGPYDSNDKFILEYQTLLMKISGIDGVLVDWYGIENYYDYGLINESTGLLFNAIKKAELSFAIVYEDLTIKHLIDGGRIISTDALKHGKTVMNYLRDNWFSKDTYFKLDDHPLLLTFGPQYFLKSSDWTEIFSELNKIPAFYTLDNQLYPVAMGSYPWPPMWKSLNGVLTQSALNEYLTQFYQKASTYQYMVASVFPGFHDIYKEAGVGSSYGYLDSQNGQTFLYTMKKALDNKPDVIQVVTWNDYGEGTIVEPTEQFGYKYLEMIQSVKDSLDSTFVFSANEIPLPLRIYNLRKQYTGRPDINEALDRVFNFIISDQVEKAVKLTDSLSKITGIESINLPPVQFQLAQNFPNPFNPTTTIKYQLANKSNVKIQVINLLGQKIDELVNDTQAPNKYEVKWNGNNYSSGVYFYRIHAVEINNPSNKFTYTKKMILMK